MNKGFEQGKLMKCLSIFAKIGRRRVALLILILLELLVRFIPHWGEGYARYVYPSLSSAVSWVASLVPFSLDEWIVILTVVFMFAFPFIAHKKGIKKILMVEVEIVGWMCAWFYLGWGLNYFRDPLLMRANIDASSVEKVVFQKFLDEYTDSLNATYTPITAIDKEAVRSEIKAIYDEVPEVYGLAKTKSYQIPKQVCFNWLYSSVGVLGYMGPFADESHLNNNLQPVQYAFTYAHELAHLLGVSNEAEANYWAYTVCRKSKIKAVRYSAYIGILPNVMRNAYNLLEPIESKYWKHNIDKRVYEQEVQLSEFWQEQRNQLLFDMQRGMFEILLKSNRIKAGHKSYDQVLNLIISIDMKDK